MGSHSVTCHPAEVIFPPLPQSELVLDLATPEGCKAELTCRCHVRGIRVLCNATEASDTHEWLATKSISAWFVMLARSPPVSLHAARASSWLSFVVDM